MTDDRDEPAESGRAIGHSRSVFPYPGGKSQLAPWIIEHLPDHECYVEVFGGSAAVLVSKDPSNVEVYNDRDGDLVHFFETFRERTDELVSHLKKTAFSRDIHRKWSRQYYAGYRPDDDVERAARFFYLRFSQFASKYTGVSGFRSMKQRSPAQQMAKARDNLHAFADRLDGVVIENLDYADLFDRFDGPETLFYCDPPYIQEGDALYTHGEFDHQRFTDAPLELEGDWLVSYTDLPSELEEFEVAERGVEYSSQNGTDGSHKQATERLVMNYDLQQRAAFSGPAQATLSGVSAGAE